MSIILRFVHSPGLLEKMQLFDTDSDYEKGFTHVEGVTTDGRYLGAHVEGVEARPMNWDSGRFTRQKFILLPASDEMTAKWVHYLRACIGEKYGYVAIFGFITHLDINQHHTTICSGFQALALRWCERFPRVLPVLAHRISVRDMDLGIAMIPDAVEIEQDDAAFRSHVNSNV